MRFDPTGMTPEQIAEMNRLNDELYGGGPSKPPSPGPIPEPPPVTTISDPGPVPAGFGNEGFGNQSVGGDPLSPIALSLPAPGYDGTVLQDLTVTSSHTCLRTGSRAIWAVFSS